MALDPNTLISHYRIAEKIGEGGMGEVYRASDDVLERDVALKIISEECCRESEKLQRFVREAKASSALNHPNIITIFEFGTDGETHFIASELIDGKTLGDVLSSGPLSVPETLQIAGQVASALSAAHAAGIVHRDIKPDNVMIRPDGLVKVLDFGVAKLLRLESSKNTDPEAETRIKIDTSPGMIIGTANYMSPEQAAAKEVDHRSDIFSFGVLVYEMLTGRLPFEGETGVEMLGAILYKDPVPLSTHAPDLPEELCAVIAKAMEKDPDARYQDVNELVRDVRAITGESEPVAIRSVSDESVQEAKTEILDRGTEEQAELADTKAADSRQTAKRSGLFGYMWVPILLVILALTAGAFWYFSGSSGEIDSIAVMPFVNESGDDDVEYLSDGMTETLISRLTRIPNLSVKASSSVFYYKGKSATPRQLGQDLGVGAVLLGKVSVRNERLKLSLELVDTATQNALWGETFDSPMSDLVDVQKEVAEQVSSQLRQHLSTDAKEDLARTYTRNSEANQLYLKGRYHWNKRSVEDFQKAIDLFKEAIDKDPTYALAYSGLADVYVLMPQYARKPSKVYMPLAKSAAQKAIELDDSLAEPHATMGYVVSIFEGNFVEAESEYERAIQLDPKYATAYQWYSEYLAAMGRNEEAVRAAKKALELEPLSLIIHTGVGLIYWITGNPDASIAHLKTTKELAPDFIPPYQICALAYESKRMFKETNENYIKAFELAGGDTSWLKELETHYEKDGWEGVWKQRIRFFLERQKQEGGGYEFIIASNYGNLENREKTLEYMRMVVDERGWRILNIRSAPTFEFLKGDPEYEAILERIGFRNLE